MSGSLDIQVGGLVVKPGEILLVTLPEDTLMDPAEVGQVLQEAGLGGRSVVIVGDAKLAAVAAE